MNERHPIPYDRLLQIAEAMHTWIFLNTCDEEAAYKEIGLTDQENGILGYGGEFVIGGEEVQENESKN